MTDHAITPPLDRNKAYGAAGGVVLGGLLMRPLAHFINLRWPGVIDADTLGDLTNLAAVGFAYVGAYASPHSS